MRHARPTQNVVSPLSGKPLEIPLSHLREDAGSRAFRRALDRAASPGPPRLLAGTYTIIGPRWHRTFRVLPVVRRPNDDPYSFRARSEGRLILSLMTGTSNELESSFQRLGFIDEFGVQLWRRTRASVELFQMASIFDQFVLRGSIPHGYTVELARACLRCGRKLTTPRSLESGIGPECRNRPMPDRSA